ncbi:5261_t:CDS:10 [Ambispora gerdemannii]|uniref:5261_t:CDS:1 n=1 Tax=Ambispora gerdemannii TaxID=144530 RepID=A0A9N8V8F2_9GLOM|nr:5261_t:CDS:10 [Ambispora gerdemannii]
MPPIPILAVALPVAFISSILEDQQQFIDTDANWVDEEERNNNNALLSSAPADRASIISCLQRIDSQILAFKTEVLEKINSNQDSFSTLYQNSGELRERINNLFTEFENVSKEVNDPEKGVKSKLLLSLQENHDVKQDAQNSGAVTEMLNYLSEVQLCIKRFGEYLADARIEEAAGIVRGMDSLLEISPIISDKRIYIFEKLKLKLASMKDMLDQTLDDLLTRAIVFERIDGDIESGSILTVATFITGPDSATHLSSIFVSLTEVNLVDMQLSRLKKNVMKYLIVPLLKHRQSWHASIKIEDDITSKLIVGSKNDNYNESVDPLFASLTAIFHFIYNRILGGPNPSLFSGPLNPSPLTTQYVSKFGNFISRDLRELVIKEYLSHMIPIETSELTSFEKIAQSARLFEAEMRRLEFMLESQSSEEEEEEHTLGAYVAKVDIHFTIRKRDRLLELGRKVMTDEVFESVVIAEDVERGKENLENSIKEETKVTEENAEKEKENKSENNEGWDFGWEEDWGENRWNNQGDKDKKNVTITNKETIQNINSEISILEPERYEITAKSKALIELTIDILNEARKLNVQSGIRLYNATLDLFDLYRAIMPVYHSNKFTDIPALAMMFYNDCMWLASELLKIQKQYSSPQPTSSNDVTNLGNDIEEDGWGFDTENMEEVNNVIGDQWSGQNVYYEDMANQLRELGQRWFDIQIETQKSVLKEFLDEMEGLHLMAREERFDVCHRVIKQIVHTLTQLNKVLKAVLSPALRYTALGLLVDSVIKRMIDDVEDLYDISAEESQQLNLICGMLFELGGLFPKIGPHKINMHVKNWEKYRHLTDILNFSLAEIMTRFRNKELTEFKTTELENLICALFADTSLRARNLQEIQEGHPL